MNSFKKLSYIKSVKKYLKIKKIVFIKNTKTFFDQLHYDTFVKAVAFEDKNLAKNIAYIKNQINSLPTNHEDLWHYNYGEIDSGNIIAKDKLVSSLLDQIRKKLKLKRKIISYDKFTLRKKNINNFSLMHADHFNDKNMSLIRSKITMQRYVINLNTNHKSQIAFLNINKNLVKKLILDPFNFEDYRKLFKITDNLTVKIYQIPPFNERTSKFYGIKFDVFNTIHSAVGKKNDLKAVISNWKRNNL